jgi:hypothetical protein
VTGKVLRKEVRGAGSAEIDLAGTDGSVVRIQVQGHGTLLRGIRVGQPMRALADFSYAADGAIHLRNGLPIREK